MWRAAVIPVLVCFAIGGCEREERDFYGRSAAADAERNAYAIGEGKHLFVQFNCVGCHAMGGGAIGPPLMDAEWIYGSDPENVRESILDGRPNGMPAFRGRIPEDRVEWLVAYVRSMSGLVPLDARPGRADAMHSKPPEVVTGRREPRPAQHPDRPGRDES